MSNLDLTDDEPGASKGSFTRSVENEATSGHHKRSRRGNLPT